MSGVTKLSEDKDASFKIMVASSYILSSTMLTVSNTVVLRSAALLPPEILLLEQQLLVITTCLLAHQFNFVKIEPIELPTSTLIIVILSFVSYAILSMYSQKFLELSLYTTLRKTQIALTVLLEYILLRKRPDNWNVVSICSILTGSILMGVSEFRGNFTGYLYTGLSNFFGALYIVSIAYHKQASVTTDSFNLIFQCSFYLAICSGVFIFTRSIDPLSYAYTLADWRVLMSVALAGTMNSAVVLNTRANSPLTQNVCSNIKDIFVFLIAQTFSGVAVTFKNAVGVLVTFAGAALFCFKDQLASGFTSINLSLRLYVFVAVGILVFTGIFMDTPSVSYSISYPSMFMPASIIEPNAPFGNISLLAVVTTSGSYNGMQLHFLDTIHRSYATLCELGFSAKLIFTAYDSVDAKWSEYLTSPQIQCHRSKASFMMDVETFPWEALPPAAFGTAGTLACRHREIFLRERDNFDFFIVQEDDVLYSVENILYFVSQYHFMRQMQPPLFPVFFDFELLDGLKYSMFRLGAGHIFRSGEELFFSSVHAPGGRGYILPKVLLAKMINETGSEVLVNCSNVGGEFNPAIASAQVLMHSQRLVSPLRNWKQGGIHHMSNKYIGMEKANSQNLQKPLKDGQFFSLQYNELDVAFSSCNGSEEEYNRTAIMIDGSCQECLRNGQSAYMLSFIYGYAFGDRQVKFVFTCE